MNLANRIKEEREKRGIKQVDMANSLNLERSNYTRLENRGSKLTLEQIDSIANAIGISTEELLGFEKRIIQNQEKVVDTEKDKEIEELKKRVAELERSLSEVRKVVDFTERNLKELCFLVEWQIRSIWEQKIHELNVAEEVFHVEHEGNTLHVSYEHEKKILDEFVFSNFLFFQYFKNEMYKYGNDSYNVIADFLPYFKEYTPIKLIW